MLKILEETLGEIKNIFRSEGYNEEELETIMLKQKKYFEQLDEDIIENIKEKQDILTVKDIAKKYKVKISRQPESKLEEFLKRRIPRNEMRRRNFSDEELKEVAEIILKNKNNG
jgi:hypothetical protein